MLRARRSNDPDALICFNLLPQETTEESPLIPGRVSETRLMLVEYWRRDQRAAAIEESRARNTGYGDLPASQMFVNGAPVSPEQTHVPPPPPFSPPSTVHQDAPPPAPVPEAAPPPEWPAAAVQAPTLDPNRVDFLSSLKSKARPSSPPPASSASGPLIIELPASSERYAAPNDPPPQSAAAASALFTESAPVTPAPSPERGRSIFETRPREAAPARPEPKSVFAQAFGEIADEPTAEFFKDEAAAPTVNTARQLKVDALQAFLARVEHRRRQIESQSVA